MPVAPEATGPPEDSEARGAAIEERNAFLESLSREARERFLAALEDAADRGLDEADAWREAVLAAELAYSDRPLPKAHDAETP